MLLFRRHEATGLPVLTTIAAPVNPKKVKGTPSQIAIVRNDRPSSATNRSLPMVVIGRLPDSPATGRLISTRQHRHGTPIKQIYRIWMFQTKGVPQGNLCSVRRVLLRQPTHGATLTALLKNELQRGLRPHNSLLRWLLHKSMVTVIIWKAPDRKILVTVSLHSVYQFQ